MSERLKKGISFEKTQSFPRIPFSLNFSEQEVIAIVKASQESHFLSKSVLNKMSDEGESLLRQVSYQRRMGAKYFEDDLTRLLGYASFIRVMFIAFDAVHNFEWLVLANTRRPEDLSVSITSIDLEIARKLIINGPSANRLLPHSLARLHDMAQGDKTFVGVASAEFNRLRQQFYLAGDSSSPFLGGYDIAFERYKKLYLECVRKGAKPDGAKHTLRRKMFRPRFNTRWVTLKKSINL